MCLFVTLSNHVFVPGKHVAVDLFKCLEQYIHISNHICCTGGNINSLINQKKQTTYISLRLFAWPYHSGHMTLLLYCNLVECTLHMLQMQETSEIL